MIIEIDLEKLKEFEINLNQLTFIQLVKINQIKIIKSFAASIISNDEVTNLIERGYLAEGSTIENPMLTDDFLDQFEGIYEKDLFKVFYEIYPTCVLRDGVKCYLRSDLQRCKKLYKQIVGNNQIKHEKLLKALKFEIEFKRKNNRTQYFKTMRNWLISEQWLEAEELMKDEKQLISVTTYGTDIQ